MARKREAVRDESVSLLGLWFEVWKALADELKELGGYGETLRRIIKDKTWRRKLAEFIVSAGQQIETTVQKFSVWRAITLGLNRSVDAYITAMESAGFQVSPCRREILAKTPISQTEVILDLVERTTKELTGKDQATVAEVFAGAARLGFDKCPAEVGPACRLADKDQLKGEWYLIGMEPIADSHGDLCIFHVYHGDAGRWLHSAYASPDCVSDGSVRWVFCRRPPAGEASKS